MAQVKFYRGLSTVYLPSSTHKDCIFFATDTNQLMLNDVAYGVKDTDAAIIANAVTSVTWVSPDTLQFKKGDGSKEYLNVTFPAATETKQGLMVAAQVVKLKGIEEGAQVNVIENVVVDGVSGTVSEKTLTINGGFAKAADVYAKADAESMVDGKIANALTAVYEYKGSVGTYEELPTTGNKKGDVYNVEAEHDLHPAGTNWVWDGSKWDALGGLVDLSGIEGDISDNADAIAKNAEDILAETNRATGIEGGLRTDLGNKSDEANENGSAFARIANLSEAIAGLKGEGTGSVSDQINAAVAALKGDATGAADTLGELEDLIEAEAVKARAAESANATAISGEETRAKGEEARIEGLVTAEANRAKGVEEGLEGRLATAESTIATLNGADTVAGSVKKQIKDAVQAEADRATGVENGLNSRIQALENSIGEGGDVAGDIADNKAAIEAIQQDYLKAADKTELQGNIDTVSGNLASHVADNVKHITAAEREAWNAAEGNAKAYADSLAGNYDAAGSASAVQGKLDEEIARAKAEEKKNADAISALTQTVNDNETDIEGKMTALTNRVSANETAIGTNADAIAENLGKINAMDAAYKAADSALETKLTGTSADTTDKVTLHGVRNYADSLLLWHEA